MTFEAETEEFSMKGAKRDPVVITAAAVAGAGVSAAVVEQQLRPGPRHRAHGDPAGQRDLGRERLGRCKTTGKSVNQIYKRGLSGASSRSSRRPARARARASAAGLRDRL